VYNTFNHSRGENIMSASIASFPKTDRNGHVVTKAEVIDRRTAQTVHGLGYWGALAAQAAQIRAQILKQAKEPLPAG
jgi:hypothetical protein